MRRPRPECPRSSHNAASSVASPPDSRTRRSTAARNAWGVAAAQSDDRSTVRTARCSWTTLMVSTTGIAAIAAPIRAAAATTADASAAVTRGRAASWTATTSSSEADRAANPARTEAERVSPPATTSPPPPTTLRKSSRRSGGAATTVRVKPPEAKDASAQESSGRPARGTRAFGSTRPRRVPLPAATIKSRLATNALDVRYAMRYALCACAVRRQTARISCSFDFRRSSTSLTFLSVSFCDSSRPRRSSSSEIDLSLKSFLIRSLPSCR